ncbi:hypothetical protein ACOSQ4_009166 [Xanthoceras sorbifolium]
MLKCLPKLKLRQIHAYNCTSLEVLSCVSFKSCFQPRDNYDIFANIGNCFKLDRNTFEDIVKDVLLKIRGLIEYIDECYKYRRARSLLCYPGHEIPEWFNFQSMGSSINMELPQNCLNRNFIGFVMCVVLAVPCLDHQLKIFRRRLHWKCNLKSKDGHPCVVGAILHNDLKGTGSHHVFMSPVCKITPYELLYCENEISFQFYCDVRIGEGKIVEKCGVHLMFAQLPEEPNVSFRVGEVKDFLPLTSVHNNCEEVDEAHPKRLKFN